MLAEGRRSVWKQYVYCLLAYLPALTPSSTLGYSAVVIPVLERTDNLTVDQISWIASSAALSTPFGCVTAGYLADFFGRVGALHLVNGVSVFGWTVIVIAYYVKNVDFRYATLLCGRIITGFSTGLVSICPIYMAEIASTDLRPIFTTVSSMFYSLGILFVYVCGLALKDAWGWIAFLCLGFPIASTVLIVHYLPESPVWLISKGRVEKAKRNMAVIYGQDGAPLVERDANELIDDHETRKLLAGGRRPFASMFLDRTIYCPFLLMSAYFLIQQLSGVMVVVFYAIEILEDAHADLDKYVTITFIALARVLTALAVSLISWKLGRRVTSLISGGGVVATMYGLMGYALLQVHVIHDDHLASLQWLPIVLLIAFIVMSTYGFLTVPFAMVAEVFPLRVRGFMVGFTIAISYFVCFVATKAYPEIRARADSASIFFIYGTAGFFGTVFLYFCLPETKGKSLREIEDHFRHRRRR